MDLKSDLVIGLRNFSNLCLWPYGPPCIKVKIVAWIPGPEWDKRREKETSVAWLRQSTRGCGACALSGRHSSFVLGGRHFLRPSVSCGFGKVPSPHGLTGGRRKGGTWFGRTQISDGHDTAINGWCDYHENLSKLSHWRIITIRRC